MEVSDAFRVATTKVESTEGNVQSGNLPIAFIDRIVNGTITTSEFTRWLPVIEIVLSAAEDRRAYQW